jgi:2-hydroxychromene-2-carboxylate isomerase
VTSLSVVLDVRHPLAYLALRPAMDFADELGIDADWLPLSVPPLNPPSAPRDDDDRGIRHRRYRAQAIAREVETYAKAQGLALREPYRRGDVDAGNLGWLWLRERQPEPLRAYLAELFRGYWSLELDAASGESIAALLDTVGAEGAAFLDWFVDEGPRAAARLAAELRERGIFQVPAFVALDEVFYGRQHLPMIRWILAGRTGPIPI